MVHLTTLSVVPRFWASAESLYKLIGSGVEESHYDLILVVSCIFLEGETEAYQE